MSVPSPAGRNILVAGGTGTIGIPVVRALVERGATVTVVSLDSSHYAREVLPEDVEFIRADLTDPNECLRVTAGREWVLNLVGIKGSTGIGTSKAASYFVPMLRFQMNLMDAAFRSGVARYLFVSSICAYPQANFHEEDSVWNGLPKQNDRYAGIAKRVGEIQAETYLQEYGWDAVRIVRPSNVYGPFDDFEPATAQVIPALIRRAIDGDDPLHVWGDGSAVRDFIFSQDLAAGLLLALEKAPPCVPINLGSGVGVTIKQLAETIAASMSRPPRIAWDPSKPTGDPVRILSTARAEKLLGFRAATSLNEGVKLTTEWYLANRSLASRKRSTLRA